jgi:2-hydroxy-3-keto-5-methylthiopentenyl-1-phosphate phosphatase
MISFSLFIDFDFTITTDDVGNRLYTYFSGGLNEPLVKRWLKREISSFTCLTEEARMCHGTPADFVSYVDKFEIDPGFGKIVDLCRGSEIPFWVLSDGLDFYIRHILAKYGFDDVPFDSNHAEFINGGLEISLPYWSEKCAECGNCKGERIRALKREDDTVIYIGDGLSDLCGCSQANLIFAKDDLADFLRKDAIDFIEYTDLTEVALKLREIVKTSSFKQVE